MSNSPVPPSVAARVVTDRSETSSPRPPLLKALERHTKKKEYVPRRNFIWRETKEADCTRACPTTDCTCPPADGNSGEPAKKHNKMQLRRRRHRHRHTAKAADDSHSTLSKPEDGRSAVASPSPASPPDVDHDSKEDSSTQYGFDTMQVHAGQILDQYAARTAPIYSSSTYEFKDALTAARLFALKEFGQIYGRITNPTNDVFERRMAALEGGVAAVSTSSGLAAISQTMFTICELGDNIVSSSSIYGGTYNQFNVTLRRLGIECRFADGYTADCFRKLIDKKTKAVYVETIGNPGFNMPDFDEISKVCKEAGVPFIVDNTFGAGGYLFRPIEHGADIVIHSTTKWIGGHGNTIGGIVIDAGTFPWNNGRFPRFVEPSAGYHGLKFWETFGPEGALKTNVCFAVRFRVETMRDLGGCQNPFGSFLLLQGLETLSLRVQKQVASAKDIAEWLTKQPEVSWVSYLGLPSHPSYELAKKYMPRGLGSVLAFGIKGGLVAGAKFTDSIRLCSHAVSIGDVRTLVTHPATTTHAQLTEQEQIASGCLPDMIRVSIGIEDVEDLKRDIKQALEKAQVVQ